MRRVSDAMKLCPVISFRRYATETYLGPTADPGLERLGQIHGDATRRNSRRLILLRQSGSFLADDNWKDRAKAEAFEKIFQFSSETLSIGCLGSGIEP